MTEEAYRKFIIYPPKGTEFLACIQCDCPFVYDGTADICLWCLIHKDEK